jgi:hypothetical protein
MTAEERLRRREQEIELYKAILDVLAKLPPGSIVADALATDEVRLIRRKWELKYGRKAPADTR